MSAARLRKQTWSHPVFAHVHVPAMCIDVRGARQWCNGDLWQAGGVRVQPQNAVLQMQLPTVCVAAVCK